MSVDPLADIYPGWSPYNYVYNNPINFVDKYGFYPEDDQNYIWDSELELYRLKSIDEIETEKKKVLMDGIGFWGFRKLQGVPEMTDSHFLRYINSEIAHEHFWSNDGKYNMGFGGKGIFHENRIDMEKYSFPVPEYFVTAIMKKVEVKLKNLKGFRSGELYFLLPDKSTPFIDKYNCQDYRDIAVKEYYKIVNEEGYSGH